MSHILCDLDPKVKVIGKKAGICDGVPSTAALVFILILSIHPGMQNGGKGLLSIILAESQGV